MQCLSSSPLMVDLRGDGGGGRGERYVEGGSSLANTAVVGIGDAWQWYGGALEAGGRGRRGPYQHFTCPGAHAAVCST